MSQRRKILFSIFVIFGVIFFGKVSFADVFSVSFRFNEANGGLTFFLDEKRGVVTIDSNNSLPTRYGEQQYPDGKYEAVFLNTSGNEIDRKRFDIALGVFSVDFPYYSIAKTLNIYKVGSPDILLSYELSEFTKCFMNGVCEYEKGENLQTCISDCASDAVQFSEETKELLKQNNDVLTDPKTGEVLLRGIQPVAAEPTIGVGEVESGGADMTVLVVGGIVIVLIVGVGIVVVRLRKRNKQYGL